MAKVGEGDARWIVSERADGANVNNWHWQEKDAFEWAKDRFKDLLGDITVADGGEPHHGVVLRTTGVTSLTGEAYVNRRKGKIIAGYELELKMGYVGEIRDADGAVLATCTGNVHFPYIADENAGEEPEAKVLAAGNGKEDDKVKDVMRKVGLPVLCKGVATFEKEIAAGGPGGEGAAPPGGKGGSDGGVKSDGEVSGKSKAEEEKEARSDRTAPLSRKAHTIKMTERFFCRPQDICDALLEAGRVMHFSRSPVRRFTSHPWCHPCVSRSSETSYCDRRVARCIILRRTLSR